MWATISLSCGCTVNVTVDWIYHYLSIATPQKVLPLFPPYHNPYPQNKPFDNIICTSISSFAAKGSELLLWVRSKTMVYDTRKVFVFVLMHVIRYADSYLF